MRKSFLVPHDQEGCCMAILTHVCLPLSSGWGGPIYFIFKKMVVDCHPHILWSFIGFAFWILPLGIFNSSNTHTHFFSYRVSRTQELLKFWPGMVPTRLPHPNQLLKSSSFSSSWLGGFPSSCGLALSSAGLPLAFSMLRILLRHLTM